MTTESDYTRTATIFGREITITVRNEGEDVRLFGWHPVRENGHLVAAFPSWEQATNYAQQRAEMYG